MSEASQRGSRVVGTVNEIVPVYIQDLSVTSLQGLPNIFASTVSASWFRSDATGASSIPIISTAALGTYSSGNWTQVNSSLARGWYEFGAPSAMFSSGRWAVLHIYGAATSTTTFSHSPIYFELTKTDNQTYVSSQTLSTAICRIYSSAAVTSAAGMLSMDVSTIYGQNIVTTAAGIISVGAVGVSSFNTGLQVGVSTFNSRVGVSSFGIDVGLSSFNTGLQVGVSSFSSRVGVSSFNLPVGVSSFDVGLQVGVSSFSSRVGVSSFGIAVGVSSVTDKTDYGVSSVTGLTVAFLDVSVSSRVAKLDYVVPDNTNIGNIQARTSSLTYTKAGQLDANTLSINGVTIVGDGSGTPFNV